MCGRYSLTSDMQHLQQRFSFNWKQTGYNPRFNIAPGQQVITITNSGLGNKAQFMQWGLIPSWSKDLKSASRMINARSETLSQKPTFAKLIDSKRCLVIADRFFEWMQSGQKKIPMCIMLKSGEPFGFAGLWDTWISHNKELINTCTIITTIPNDLISPIHHRLPVIIPDYSESDWLNPVETNTDYLKELLVPYEAHYMEAYQVSTSVNSPSNDRRDILDRVV